MAQGIGLLYTPGAGSRPELLLMRDLHRQCSVCGMEDARRFFEATSAHALTERRADTLARASTDESWDCPQCGTPLRPADDRARALHIPVNGGNSTISAFSTVSGSAAKGVRWQIAAMRPFDVQLPARWNPEDDHFAPCVDALDDAAAIEHLGRPFHLKGALRQALIAWLRADTASFSEPKALLALRDLVVVGQRFSPLDAEGALAIARGTGALTTGWIAQPLLQDGLLDDSLPGSPSEWLSDLPSPLLDELTLWAVASPGSALSALEAQIRMLPLDVSLRPQGDVFALRILGAPGEPEALIDPLGIAEEAARTLLPPADAARIELDRALLLLSEEPDDGEEE